MENQNLNELSFTCINCGNEVSPQIDNSVRNHCNHCLCSKHVDIFPNDNANTCHAQMNPVNAVEVNDELFIVHKCTFCDKSSRYRMAIDDNYDVIVNILNSNK